MMNFARFFFFFFGLEVKSAEKEKCGVCQCVEAVAERGGFLSEHKERKGIDKQSTPKPSWLGTNHVRSCLPAREPPQK